MLEIKYIADDIIEVKEILMGFNLSQVSYWYYDIVNWIRYHNRPISKPMTVELIRSNPAPDEKYHNIEPMGQSNIEWVKKYYIPKAKK